MYNQHNKNYSKVNIVQRRLVLLTSTIVLILSTLIISCRNNIRKADLVLNNGKIYTANPDQPTAHAIAIKGNQIIAVNNNGKIDRFIGPKTRVIDVEGMFVCPGFNDAHFHLFSGYKSIYDINLTNVQSVRDIQRQILKGVRKLPPGTWLVGRGWDQNLLPGGKWPSRRNLDVIAPHVPIFLLRICGHVAVVNSKALQIAGITSETPDPPGGEIDRDIKGKPTGILKGEAKNLVSQYIPPPSEDQIIKYVGETLEKIKKYGITTIQDHSNADVYRIYQQYLDKRKLTCRISVWFPLQENLKEYKKVRDKNKDSYLRFGMLKGFIDGSMGSRTANFFNPYSDAPDTYGIPRMTQNQLNYLVLLADREGFQTGIHAIGDKANRMALDAYELTQKLNGIRERRHRIEHAQVLSRNDLSRLGELGVVASMQPLHCIEDMQWAESRIGQHRCRYAYAWKSLLTNGAALAFGSDWPVVSMNPLLGIYAAITRRDTLGYPVTGWFPQERLSLEEAIDAYTFGSAYAESMENEKGSLEPGKLADIVVLNKNLFEISPKQILKTKVIYTILGGQIIYSQKEE
jgi:predicted amidohydrolase YtcJ